MLARLRIQRKTNAVVEQAQADEQAADCNRGSPGQTWAEPAAAFTGVTQIPVHQSLKHGVCCPECGRRTCNPTQLPTHERTCGVLNELSCKNSWS
jgi:hypothetical protein